MRFAQADPAGRRLEHGVEVRGGADRRREQAEQRLAAPAPAAEVPVLADDLLRGVHVAPQQVVAGSKRRISLGVGVAGYHGGEVVGLRYCEAWRCISCQPKP